jgi:hypothetical protein
MREKTWDEIDRCLEHARNALKKAHDTADPELRVSYIAMAQRWRMLAKNAEMADELGGTEGVKEP